MASLAPACSDVQKHGAAFHQEIIKKVKRKEKKIKREGLYLPLGVTSLQNFQYFQILVLTTHIALTKGSWTNVPLQDWDMYFNTL